MEGKESQKGIVQLTIKTLGSTKTEQYQINGSSIAELMKTNHKIEFTNSMVKCIDNVCAKNGFWWHFYVNDKIVLDTINNHYPKKGEKIVLEYNDKLG